MKDKETINLLLIMLVSSVLLVFLYIPPKKLPIATKDFNNLKKEVPISIEVKKINSSLVYKMTKY